MRLLFTICGRAGSKGIKNKNLRKFCDKYLAYYSISVIDLFLRNHPDYEYDIAANSDSQELLDLLTGNKMRKVVPLMRSAELAGDTVGKIAVICDCLSRMETETKSKYDMVIDLDITSPLRTVEDLEKVIETHIRKRPDVTTTVATARRNPYFNQVMKTEHGYKKVIQSTFTSRQQAPEIFDMNASIYAYSPSFLLSGLGVLDGYCEVVEMYDTGILDLDHENDFELMEIIARYLFEKDDRFGIVRKNIET